ncbi:MAG: thioredoxin:protein disulfide reductase, partial [Myxococcales bacterium]|nr:thioredoxin:protein disulfide reductase [Myxococcales bacterium]
MIFALTAGLLTALTPCVYPMIPITISIFGAKAGVSRARALVLATFYVAGIAAMFGTLGTVFALLGKAFGTFLANPWVIVPLALFFVAMALSMFGAFELTVPGPLQARLSRVGGRGLGGAFLMGLVGGIIAAPCTGPPLAAILAYVATTRDAVFGFALLSTYAVGFGVPFWVLAGFSMSLPRSGGWMDAVKSVFGIALLTAALYYLKNVVPSLGHLTGRTPLFLVGALCAVIAGGVLGAVHLTFHQGTAAGVRKAVGVALATVGLFAVTNYALTPKSSIELTWLRSENEALAAARAAGQPLVIDFMADWCLPCRELDLKVFSHPDVAQAMQDFTLLRVDLTREDDEPALGVVKKKYAADTLPAVRIVSPTGAILGRTDEVLTPTRFLDLLSRAKHA